jgi:hypothetical protein
MRLRDVETVGSIALVMDAGDDPPLPPAGARVAGDESEQIEVGLYDDPSDLEVEDPALDDEELDDAEDGDDEPDDDTEG